MLETIELVRWEDFSDAYGRATAVPGLLRQLASADPEESRVAALELFGRIVHQGDTSTAAVAAAPFLIELAGDPRVGHRPLVLALLHDVATCLYPSVSVAVDAHRAAVACVPCGIELLGHGDGMIRAGAAHLLGAFPEERGRIEPALREGLRVEADALVRAGFLMAIMALGARDGATVALLRERFAAAASAEERWAAALALACAQIDGGAAASEEAAHALVDNYLTGHIGGPLLDPLPWDWSAEVSNAEVFAALGPELVAAVVVPRLFDELTKRSSPWWVGDIYTRLLCAVFPEKPASTDPAQWTATQRHMLTAIADDGRVWADADARHGVAFELAWRRLTPPWPPWSPDQRPYDYAGARASLRSLLAST